FVGISWQWSSAVQARDESRYQAGQKEIQRRNAVLARQQALEEKKQAELARNDAKRESLAREEQRKKADAAREVAETNVYFSRIAQARLEWQLNNSVPAARKLLDLCRPREKETDRRGWEWSFLNGLNHTELLAFQGQNRGYIHQLAYSPDGAWMACAGGGNPFQGSQHIIEPGEVLLFDARTGAPRPPLRGHGSVVTDARFSPDGQTLASCGYDSTVKLWNVADGRLLRTITVPDGRWLYAVAFTPDGRQVISGNGNGTATLWEVQTGEAARQFQCGYRLTASLAFSPDGKYLATAGQSALDASGPVKLWDAKTGRPLREFGTGARHTYNNVTFSADGRFLATVDRTARVWEVDSGRLLHTFAPETELLAVAFRPDGRQLATASADYTVRLWDLKNGEQQSILRGHAAPVHTLVYHPSGRLLASGDIGRQVKVWDLTRHPEYTFAQQPRHRYPEGLTFNAAGDRVLCMHRNGELATLDPVTAVTCDSQRLDLTGEWLTPGTLAAFDGAASRLATIATGRRQARLYETASGKELNLLSGPQTALYQVALSGDGRRVAAAGIGMTQQQGPVREITVWDSESGQPLTTFYRPAPLKNRLFGGLKLSPDGRLLAFDDYGLEQSAQGPKPLFQVKVVALDERTDGLPRTVHTWSGHESILATLAFSADGRYLASADQTLVFVWDLKTGKPLFEQPLQGPGHLSSCQLAFSPNGKRLAIVNRELVKMWDVGTGQEVLTLRGAPARHGDGGFNPLLSWSPDGQRLAALNWNGGVSVWDAAERTGLAAQARERRNAEVRGFYWHLDSAIAAAREGDYSLLGFHTRQLQDLQPPDATARLHRTELSMRFGQWRQSADEFNDLCPGQVPAELNQAYLACASRLLTGDLAAYRQGIAGLLQRYRGA
ncbi:MAG: hypothetical protein JNM56_19640, partial [Planctomycetia bacterium]|nr:hypothetical protein [Planctomycetia bacterium]